MARKKAETKSKKGGLRVVNGGKGKKSSKKKDLKKKGKKKSKEKVKFEASAIVPHNGKEHLGELRQKVIEAKETVDVARWLLAEGLYGVHDVAAFSHWGYPSWESYVDNEVGVTVRTAQYLTAMYHYFTVDIVEDVRKLDFDNKVRLDAEDIQDHIIKEVRSLGWTKAKSLVGVVNRENYEEWLEKAREMTSKDLNKATKAFLKGDANPGPSEKFKRWGAPLALEQHETVVGAVEMAKEITGSDKPGNCITLICQEFTASNMSMEKGDRSYSAYLNKTGAQLGVRLIAVDKDTGKIVHNKKLYEELSGNSVEKTAE
jgi:hypothetical protein